MSESQDIESVCETIEKDYSPCDVSDALLKLGIPSAGYLRDIVPLPTRLGSHTRIVAPISTVLFVDKTHKPGSTYRGLDVPSETNLPPDKHFTDIAPSGSAVIMQQPSHQTAALVGDIVATRFKVRGISSIVIDGRVRDVVGCGELCKDDKLQVWSKAISSSGTSLEAKPWAVDVPLRIGEVVVKPGDVLVADEGEMVCCVIPKERLGDVMGLLPKHKKADDGLLQDVQNGMGFKEAIKRWPGHYTNH
ncbi:uncharacterized protein LTR77_000690 [Saxophila tyrrhenica]|uniref:Uncharacterized protein n=1 Tax=Saxophila tyrrhenica TaxID=1690608 RepID=A0AAV9PP95_9PEZI|nr:hypothetical protein LTR77_000690 [Saxophila tyrrhenica]